MSEKDGGYAFPNGFQPENCECDHGMTLRDYFAAKAIAGILAAVVGRVWNEHDSAQAAYDVADAMLKARVGK